MKTVKMKFRRLKHQLYTAEVMKSHIVLTLATIFGGIWFSYLNRSR